jgi:hypothetical protein
MAFQMPASTFLILDGVSKLASQGVPQLDLGAISR